jgi:cytidylate kinase
LEPVVTISSTYGTGGEHLGRTVAARLGLPFLDRAIPATVAREVMASFEEIAYQESHPAHGLGQWIGFFSPLGSAWLGVPDPLEPWRSEREYLDHTESVIRRAAEHGVVILGRGASIILRDHPRALHVHLDGPPERRIRQAIERGGVDAREAHRAQKQTDSARRHYLQHFYRADVRDPGLYHLCLDTTALPLGACADLICRAALARLEVEGYDRDL